jgi:hypothetical protein
MVRCRNSKEMIVEIKKCMFINNIQQKELSVITGKKPQSISKMLKPDSDLRISTVFEILDGLGIKMILDYNENPDNNKDNVVSR